MRVVRSRVLRAPVTDVWRVLEDPYALPRWWPLVRRVEAVDDGGWTMVLGTPGGRGVRADQRLEPAGEGCELALALVQRPRGWARFGWIMLRRAGRRQLDEALAGMARAVE